MAEALQPSADVGRLINLVPVGLKEAAIDSPTSRASIVHLADQVDLLERWLEEYMKSTNRLILESVTLEQILHNFTSHAILPGLITESMLDHDYSMLAIKRCAEGAKDFWMSTLAVVKKLSYIVVEPIRQFLAADIKAFKEARRLVDQSQKNYDTLMTKYASQSKSKDPSSLREEAFQLHEARKLYLRHSLDFSCLTPQLRFNLDKLLVKIFVEQWREMRASRENSAAAFQRSAQDMDRVRSWRREMENGERTFKKELTIARKQLEEAAEETTRPSRELEDYSLSTIPQMAGTSHAAGGASIPRSPKRPMPKSGEKQGWLYLKTFTGKPTRQLWVKRWAFVRNGVFGWLIQGTRAGGVEETERIGVLLCNVRPAPQEDRRYCFELKTNRNTIFLQAETQFELAAWINAIETAKARAVDDPRMSDTLTSRGRPHSDPAFSISVPPIPEFGTLILSTTEPGTSDDHHTIAAANAVATVDLGKENAEMARKSAMGDDQAPKIVSRLDLNKKPVASPQLSPSTSSTNVSGGIASLIAASHGSMPVGPSLPMVTYVESPPPKPRTTFALATRDMQSSSLAPSTLVNPPVATSLSKSAVSITGERGISAAADKTGIPTSLLANIWGSSSSSYINRLERTEVKLTPDTKIITGQPSPLVLPSASPPKSAVSFRTELGSSAAASSLDLSSPMTLTRSRTPSPTKRHRATISLDRETAQQLRSSVVVDFPNYYPVQLKTQDAQFRLLFPTVRRDERLVMVFRATWNPNDQQDFPGRVYVTSKEVYFYSNHFGLVLTSSVSLTAIDEVTAAPGRECDFLFLHLKEASLDSGSTRITIKVFLEPLKLLQRRLNFLAHNSVAENPLALEEVIKALLKMENEKPDRSSSLESWEDIAPDTPVDQVASRSRPRSLTAGTDFKAPLHVDRALHTSVSADGERTAKFRLPAQPVKYTPAGNLALAVEREFDVSPKSLFHLMFGDKSAIWQLLQHERRATNLKQGPWVKMGEGRLRREFEFIIPTLNAIGTERSTLVHDYQVVDVNSDHLCYVVTDKRTPWHLPFQDNYRLLSKIVITHVAKTRCKLAIFVKVEWLRDPMFMKGMLERQALHDLELDSQDVTDLVADQVRKLGTFSRTKKAIQIYGQLGHANETTQLEIDKLAINLELRRMPVCRSALSLALQGAASYAEGTAGGIIDAMVGFVTWVAKTCSANSVILTLLVLSALYNSWHTARDTSLWWRERNAASFMNRIGVAPGNVLTKSIYLSDLDTMISEHTRLPYPAGDFAGTNSSTSIGTSNPCYTFFADEYALHDGNFAALPSSSITSTGYNLAGSQANAARERLLSARRQIGTYRHDLLVSMRVLNRVEVEMVQSEWESFVFEESRRCRRVEGLIGEELGIVGAGKDAKKAKTKPKTKVKDEGVEELKVWYDEYCGSCKAEFEKISLSTIGTVIS